MANDRDIPKRILLQLRWKYQQLLTYIENMRAQSDLTALQEMELDMFVGCQVVEQQLDEWLGTADTDCNNIGEHIKNAEFFMTIKEENLPDGKTKALFLEACADYHQLISEHTGHNFNKHRR